MAPASSFQTSSPPPNGRSSGRAHGITSLDALLMNPAELIDAAIERGQSFGIDALTDLERMVFLISEAEVYCANDGIDSFIDRYGTRGRAMPPRAGVQASETPLDRADALVVDHVGWDYDAIHSAVARRLSA
jgi:hypothetical protein